MRSHRKYLYFLIGLSLSIHCERDKEIYLSNPDSISDTSYIPVDTLTICDSLDQGFIDLEQYPSTVKKYRIIFTQKSYIYSINITGDNLYRLSNRIASSFKISADRSKIIFLSENILHIIDNDGENEKELITYDRSLRDIDISRDGEKILYRDSLGINIINSNGENINIIPFPTGVFLRFFSDDMILIHSSGQLLLLDQSGTVVNESPKYFFYTSYSFVELDIVYDEYIQALHFL